MNADEAELLDGEEEKENIEGVMNMNQELLDKDGFKSSEQILVPNTHSLSHSLTHSFFQSQGLEAEIQTQKGESSELQPSPEERSDQMETTTTKDEFTRDHVLYTIKNKISEFAAIGDLDNQETQNENLHALLQVVESLGMKDAGFVVLEEVLIEYIQKYPKYRMDIVRHLQNFPHEAFSILLTADLGRYFYYDGECGNYKILVSQGQVKNEFISPKIEQIKARYEGKKYPQILTVGFNHQVKAIKDMKKFWAEEKGKEHITSKSPTEGIYYDALDNATKEELDNYHNELYIAFENFKEILEGVGNTSKAKAVTSRLKSTAGMWEKAIRMVFGTDGRRKRETFAVGDELDLIGGRILSSDIYGLNRAMVALADLAAQGTIAIVEKDNKYVNPNEMDHAYNAVHYAVSFEANGFPFLAEIQLLTLAASLAADLYHNTRYKEIVPQPQFLAGVAMSEEDKRKGKWSPAGATLSLEKNADSHGVDYLAQIDALHWDIFFQEWDELQKRFTVNVGENDHCVGCECVQKTSALMVSHSQSARGALEGVRRFSQ